MKRSLLLILLLTMSAHAAIRRDPSSVNVHSQGATTVFITFGGLANQVAAEGFWCGELIDASPGIGQQCDANTLYGRLPGRYDVSSVQGSVFTDVMTIPPNVARRAYEAAVSGERSSFYYVRRFVSANGGPDEFVSVALRMAAAGARTPLSLTNVHVAFEVKTPLLRVRPGSTPPKFGADVQYRGTGRLQGRWEIALPTDEPPTSDDLLTEASLPVEKRGLQRRYTQLGRFNVFLPPTGRVHLPGPDPKKLPTATEGQYQVLLRIEASDDGEGDSDLAAASAGRGIVHSGGVAGFPMPVLRYFVGSGSSPVATELALVAPLESAVVPKDAPLEFRWNEQGGSAFHRLEVRDAANALALEAVLDSSTKRYLAPPWFRAKATGALRWRVAAIDGEGRVVHATHWRAVELTP